MTLALLIVCAWLVALNLFAGVTKASMRPPRLVRRMPWVRSTGVAAAYTAAWAEILGCVGIAGALITWGILDFPAAILWIAAVAATGLAVIQIAAAAVHIARSEYRAVVVNAALFALALAAVVLSAAAAVRG